MVFSYPWGLPIAGDGRGEFISQQTKVKPTSLLTGGPPLCAGPPLRFASLTDSHFKGGRPEGLARRGRGRAEASMGNLVSEEVSSTSSAVCHIISCQRVALVLDVISHLVVLTTHADVRHTQPKRSHCYWMPGPHCKVCDI